MGWHNYWLKRMIQRINIHNLGIYFFLLGLKGPFLSLPAAFSQEIDCWTMDQKGPSHWSGPQIPLIYLHKGPRRASNAFRPLLKRPRPLIYCSKSLKNSDFWGKLGKIRPFQAVFDGFQHKIACFWRKKHDFSEKNMS